MARPTHDDRPETEPTRPGGRFPKEYAAEALSIERGTRAVPKRDLPDTPPDSGIASAGRDFPSSERNCVGRHRLNPPRVEDFEAPPVSLRTVSRLLNSLFKVLFNFPSRYLFAIGLAVVFSLGRSLPPVLGLHSRATRLSGVVLPIRGAEGTGLAPATAKGPRSRGLASVPRFGRDALHTPQVPRRLATQGFGAGLFPFRSPLLGESLLFSFPPLTDMLKFSGFSRLIRGRFLFAVHHWGGHFRLFSTHGYRDPKGRHGNRLSLCKLHATLGQARLHPRREGAAMCVRIISDLSVLQFTPNLAAGCVLHRPASRVIHCSELSDATI
ncbi:uncharacterized protein TNIN_153281 [Trichonephila inaurata madagascariensis]|uniref:Uncharacterized protein n=1 Tax=Trichonephila inaurata madagascariensis TaxID=2747483 RepID=A0A8X6XTV4_9ARAC|nr:uncharacterized protein TNIN_153281 [Trichonephila inaurata madagascariensis]